MDVGIFKLMFLNWYLISLDPFRLATSFAYSVHFVIESNHPEDSFKIDKYIIDNIAVLAQPSNRQYLWEAKARGPLIRVR